MPGVKLSDIIQALHQDEQMRKLAVDSAIDPASQATPTDSPISDQTSDTIEDEKAKIQTKLMELAGLQDEGASAAKAEEALNVAQEAPAGEAVAPEGVNPAASAAAPEEMATVMASVLSKMQPPLRKQACIAIVQKIGQMNALTLDDVSDEKVASARFQEYDAAGRIMARAYHNEVQKIAEELEGGGEKPATGPEATGDITDDDIKILESLTE